MTFKIDTDHARSVTIWTASPGLTKGLGAEARAQGFVLTCVGHAEGDVKLDA